MQIVIAKKNLGKNRTVQHIQRSEQIIPADNSVKRMKNLHVQQTSVHRLWKDHTC